ncbi:hypothetical protein I5H96_gp51 [Mycobacterium phage Veteran]|uniref:Uncharacterized protein n=1 Tax=Mycobacterium phage Veteran TaxID=2719209 RepID=A0A6G9LEI9_9CAUD|nr:hypothetical protein I5H96_gp51 [Mycobacterium phage Veteran]QIQ63399.1 hypothetical protein SEA_VETERAN_51 [Mycobacterium phage Veteran]QYW01412.1 hypothetical protein SEA_ERADICATOR_47 [Mycobacterium phage Eradicator]
MITNHENATRHRLDLPSLILTLVGLVFGAISYWLISSEHVNVLVIVPSVVAVVIGVTHLVKLGDTGPGAGMVPPPPPAPGPSKCTCPTVECELLAEDICDEAEEAELLDEFMELGEFLDSATAEELAAMRQQHATAAELERHLRYFTTAPGASGVNPGVVAQSLLEIYRITPK